MLVEWASRGIDNKLRAANGANVSSVRYTLERVRSWA